MNRCATLPRAAVAAALALGSALASAPVHAEGPYEGTWQASPMRVRVSVESWGDDCGPRPPSASTEPGGPVRIEQAGSELRLSGAMGWRTDRCFTPNRAARRVSASAGDGQWRVVCRTPEDDPKAEDGTYVLRSAGEDRLAFRERSRYDWQLKSSRCVATRTAERTLTRTGGAVAGPATGGAAEGNRRGARCEPGEPARLVLTPSREAIEAGRRVCFVARAFDARGCPVRDARIRYAVDPSSPVGGEMRGRCFEAGSAAEAEGTHEVVARLGPLTERATVVVRPADLSDLIARGAFGGTQDAGTAAEETARPPEPDEASRVAARTTRESADRLWPILGASLALVVLVALALLMVVRRRAGTGTRPGSEPAGPGPPSMPAASARPPGPELRCPVCHRDYPSDTLFCPGDGSRLSEPAEGPEPAAPKQGMICPACRRGYAPQARFCPHDSEELVPYAAFVDRQRREEAGEVQQGRICPTCGERYDASQAFCGKDGSELVLVN